MDTTIRRRQREAAAGDPAAEAAWLAERLRAAPVCERCGGRRTWRDCSRHRDDQVSCGPACGVWKEALPCPACAGTGSPFRARLELAAYCGSEVARAALGGGWLRDGWVHPDVLAMESWVRGLNAWADVGPVPGWVLVRAAVAAARVALPKARRGVSGPGGQSMSATAAREEARATVRTAHRAITAAEAWLATPDEERLLAWRVAFSRGSNDRTGWAPMPEPLQASTREGEIRHAARLVGEAPVRAAISSALIAWALA